MEPNKVIYPKDRIEEGSLEVLFNDTSFSIASLKWKNGDSGKFEQRIGIRWNGSGSYNGYPKGAFGRPTWFILPKEVALSYAKTLGNIKMEEIVKQTSDTPFAE